MSKHTFVVLIAVLSTWEMLLIRSLLTPSNIDPIDKTTVHACATMAKKYKEEWKNTEFKDFDWYTSCLNNIRHTSPLKKY